MQAGLAAIEDEYEGEAREREVKGYLEGKKEACRAQKEVSRTNHNDLPRGTNTGGQHADLLSTWLKSKALAAAQLEVVDDT